MRDAAPFLKVLKENGCWTAAIGKWQGSHGAGLAAHRLRTLPLTG